MWLDVALGYPAWGLRGSQSRRYQLPRPFLIRPRGRAAENRPPPAGFRAGHRGSPWTRALCPAERGARFRPSLSESPSHNETRCCCWSCSGCCCSDSRTGCCWRCCSTSRPATHGCSRSGRAQSTTQLLSYPFHQVGPLRLQGMAPPTVPAAHQRVLGQPPIVRRTSSTFSASTP